MQPETRYAKSGDVNIAYQVTGEGPRDLVLVPGWVSHLEADWDHPLVAHFLNRLSGFSRLIRFDKRGTGLSDRSVGLPDLETRMDDVRAVMEAVGSERAALFGYSEGGPMCCLFAATYPERAAALVLYGSYAKRRDPDEDYPWAATWESRQEYAREVERDWGVTADIDRMGPHADRSMVDWWVRRGRAAASPGTARDLILMNSQIDVRHVLPAIGAPTLVMHRVGDADSKWEEGRYIGEHVPGARFMLFEGGDHLPWLNGDEILDEIEEFLTGVRRGPEPDRVLATVLFTDIVGSTERATELGDRAWRELLERHHSIVRRELDALPWPRGRHRGRRLPCHVRRAGACDSKCPRDFRRSPRRWAGGTSRPAHRGVRVARRQGRGHRRAHRRAGRRTGRPRRGARVSDGQGSRRRFGDRVRGTRHA